MIWSGQTIIPRMLFVCDPGSPLKWGGRYKKLFKDDPQVEARVAAGLRFALRQEPDPDFRRAAKWFRVAAKMDSPYGQYWLATLYMLGYGLTRNLPLSLYWLKRAATQGYPPAQYALGQCYLRGFMVAAKDEEKARELFYRAAFEGHRGAKAAFRKLKDKSSPANERRRRLQFSKNVAGLIHFSRKREDRKPARPLILIVNDEKEIVDLCAYALAEKGYRIRKAYDGDECLAQLAQYKPDFLILNGLMLTMNGDEVLRRMAENPEWCRIPIVMISAWFTESRTQPKYLECNKLAGKLCLDWLPEPFEIAELIKAVERSLNRSKNGV